MKKYLVIFFIAGAIIAQLSAYPKKSLVERYTNASCGPCAEANVWYIPTTLDMVNSNSIAHIVYNVNWPGTTDPMYLLNSSDNAQRWSYYGVNAVPWIDVNGTTISTDQVSLTNAVNSGNSQISPFRIILTPEIFSNKVMNIHVKILHDPGDVTSFQNTMLQVGLTEKTVAFSSPPGANGESVFYSITRKMLPDAKGTLLNIPAPGDSLEMDLMYFPTTSFLTAVNLDSLRVVAFIQNDNTKEIYQSEMSDMQKGTHINAAFQVDDNLGAAPFSVSFHDYSTPADSAQITSWKWDFNNDGVIESTDPNPVYKFQDKQSYTVSLTVTDNKQHQYTRTLTNFITAIGSSSDILVVNGIDYSTAAYVTEMTNFYNNSVCFGNHNVDIWDLFGGQGFNFAGNSKVKQVDLFNRTIPVSVLKLYKKIVWIGNNYNGDLNNFNSASVIQYVQQGGNFLLATRMASTFFDASLQNYCGAQLSGDLTVDFLHSLDNNLVNMSSITSGTNTLVDLVMLNSNSQAIPIFTSDTTSSWKAGFRMHNANEGVFIFIAGRPYRYDPVASSQNYSYILDNWMTAQPTGIKDNGQDNIAKSYNLDQNYPNPFNPSTSIRYSVPNDGMVNLSVYNTLGQKVGSLVNQFTKAGNYEVKFDASRYASGIYFYRIESGSFTSVKKMILMK
ncbi:MAG: T9SS type A sorting domain-containing protein [Ignavibacteriaceae bacterium]|nr:T9SS type A sorting domain-containing protein [Ignavibacteriaceae bacterium]